MLLDFRDTAYRKVFFREKQLFLVDPNLRWKGLIAKRNKLSSFRADVI